MRRSESCLIIFVHRKPKRRKIRSLLNRALQRSQMQHIFLIIISSDCASSLITRNKSRRLNQTLQRIKETPCILSSETRIWKSDRERTQKPIPYVPASYYAEVNHPPGFRECDQGLYSFLYHRFGKNDWVRKKESNE